jgi:hypothetical protein
MTTPEVRKALRAHVDRLRAWREATGAPWLLGEIQLLNALILELCRRRHAGPRRVTSERMTPEKRMEIREYARAHPELTQTEITLHLNVNQGRVSETLHGFRR